MKITVEEVEHVARLARLEVSTEEKQNLTEQLNEILLYMEKLNELDTTGVVPTSHVVDLHNAFREDIVEESMDRTETLKNAPEDNDAEFVVPRVISPLAHRAGRFTRKPPNILLNMINIIIIID